MVTFDPKNARALEMACEIIRLESGILFGDATPDEVRAELRRLRARVDAFSAMLIVVGDGATMRDGLCKRLEPVEVVKRSARYLH